MLYRKLLTQATQQHKNRLIIEIKGTTTPKYRCYMTNKIYSICIKIKNKNKNKVRHIRLNSRLR